MINKNPPRFEDEFPEEAAILMEICHERGKAKDQGQRLKPLYLDAPLPIAVGITTGRNEPCPCGSGKKYKKCCINA
jgi:uncharacterized protein YecA (UPF0149 family)